MGTWSAASGFTIYELMITLAIGAILLALAAPDMSGFIKNNRLTTTTNELVAHINITRGETIKRRANVVLCRSGNPNASPPSCGGSDRDYSTGWIIYEDVNGDLAYTDGTDELITAHPAAPSGVSITSNASGNNYLHFKLDGTLEEGGIPAYGICDDRGEKEGKVILVAYTGRTRVVDTTASSATDCTPSDDLNVTEGYPEGYSP